MPDQQFEGTQDERERRVSDSTIFPMSRIGSSGSITRDARFCNFYEVDSRMLPSEILRHAFQAAQLNAAATAAIPIPAKIAVARRGHRGLAQASSRTCS